MVLLVKSYFLTTSSAQISNPFTVCCVFGYTWSDWIVSIFTDLMLQINFVYSWCTGQFFKHSVTVLSEDVKYEIKKLGQCWFPFLKNSTDYSCLHSLPVVILITYILLWLFTERHAEVAGKNDVNAYPLPSPT